MAQHRIILPRTEVVRPVDGDSFADLLPDAAVEVRHVGENLLLDISRELSDAERAAVVVRIATDPDTDEVRTCADGVLADCQAFLDNPAPTAEDVAAQAQVLSCAVTVILRLLLRRP